MGSCEYGLTVVTGLTVVAVTMEGVRSRVDIHLIPNKDEQRQ